MEDHNELGTLIREARLGRGLSLGQLATAVGRSSSSVRRWERGEVMPAARVLGPLAEVLEIDLSELEGAKSRIAQLGVLGGEGSGVPALTVEEPVVVSQDPAPRPLQEHPEREAAQVGVFSDVWRVVTAGRQYWIGWGRGLLTASVLLAMFLILLWALGELFGAIGAIVDSFEIGSSPTQDREP